MEAQSLPYVQRAATSTIRLSKSLSRALRIFADDLATTEVLRNLALSVATVDRCLTQLIVQVLHAASVPATQEEPLDSLLHRLQALPSEKLAKLLPPGGLVSLTYHLDCCLSEVERRLRESERGRLLPALVAFLGLVPFIRRLRRYHLVRVFGMVFFYLWSWTPFAWLVNRRRRTGLAEASALLSVLVRLWSVSSSSLNIIPSGPGSSLGLLSSSSSQASMLTSPVRSATGGLGGSLPRARSYVHLIAEPADHDFILNKRAVARRLLEDATLPRNAAVWPTRSLKSAILKVVLDVFYGTFAGTYHLVMKRPSGRSGQPKAASMLDWLLFIVVSAVRAVYFILSPSQAAEATARAMRKPDIRLIQLLWRMADGPLMRRLAAWINRRELEQGAGGFFRDVYLHRDSSEAEEGGNMDNSGGLGVPTFLISNVRSAGLVAAHQRFGKPKDNSFGAESDASPGIERPLRDGTSLPKCIFYINGGGFVGRFAPSDFKLLSEWVQDASEPVVAAYTCYSLAPEAKFPVALLELARTYLWLAERCGGGKNIVVTGESAGGNLSAALVLYLLWHAPHLLPSGLVLVYPALCLNPSPSPSRALHLNDPVVPPRLLIACATGYCGVQFPLSEVYEEDEDDEGSGADEAAGTGSSSGSGAVIGGAGATVAAASSALPSHGLPPLAASFSPQRRSNLSLSTLAANAGAPVAQSSSPPAAQRGAGIRSPPSSAGSSSSSSAMRPAADSGGTGGPLVAAAPHPHHQPTSPLLRIPSSRSSMSLVGALCGEPYGQYCSCFNSDVRTHPLVHPAYVSDGDLARFPPTSILVGGVDPLLDDGVDFETRLRRLGVAGRLKVYRSLPHGYLFFQGILPGAREAAIVMRDMCFESLQVTLKAKAKGGKVEAEGSGTEKAAMQ